MQRRGLLSAGYTSLSSSLNCGAVLPCCTYQHYFVSVAGHNNTHYQSCRVRHIEYDFCKDWSRNSSAALEGYSLASTDRLYNTREIES